MDQKCCNYVSPQGVCCEDAEHHNGLCFWHADEQIKEENTLIEALEERARTGRSMSGFSLRKAELVDVNLVHHGSKKGYDLSYCDFYRANLQKAHLFNADLHGASLMKADLRGANLHCANLKDTNLLGVKLEGARLDNIRWGHYVQQENKARQARDSAVRSDMLEQAEEVYRNLRRVLENEGLFEQAGYFFRREMVMRRLQMPLFSMQRLVSKVVDLFCGYGERPIRIVAFSVFLILGFAVLFFFNGVQDSGELVRYRLDQSITENLLSFMNALYFSIVTFTTLGYGDITPTGYSRAFAAVEAFAGSFTLALFVVVFVKKMTR